MSAPAPWLIGVWSRPTIASRSKTGYLFCGVLVGPRQVLTVKHGLGQAQTLYARPMAAATDAFAVVDAVQHPTLDAALLTLEMAPAAAAPLSWATDDAPTSPLKLTGVFEGKLFEAIATLGAPDPAHRHHTFTPEQPKGVSGGALISATGLWGMAVRRYGDEGIGCAIPFYLLRDWLAEQLAAAHVSQPNLPPPASVPGVTPRVKSLVGWLDSPARVHLAAALIESARSALESSAGVAAPMDTSAALMALARFRTAKDPIAGIHLLGRALKRARDLMGEDGYATQIAPRVADLLACVLGIAFDCDCAVIDATGVAADSRVRRTPFAGITATAMLAAQLFEGELQFVPAEGGGWRPEWVFTVNAPANGQLSKEAFYREAYRRMVGVDTPADLSAQAESLKLSLDELGKLRRRIRERLIEDECLVAFVDGLPQMQLSPARVERGEAIAADLGVNVLLMAEDAPGKPTLRMSVAEFEDVVLVALDRHASPRPTR